MGIFTRSSKTQKTVTTTTTHKPTLSQRLKGAHSHKTQHTSKPHTVKTARPAKTTHHKAARSNGVTKNGVPRRKTSIGDKVSGLMMKVKGSATHRPGEKAAGTRRMHGTDGRGSRRVY